MSGAGDSLDLKDGRRLLHFLAGIGVETLYTAGLLAIGALVVLVARLLTR